MIGEPVSGVNTRLDASTRSGPLTNVNEHGKRAPFAAARPSSGGVNLLGDVK
jgi:hypothetical protein